MWNTVMNYELSSWWPKRTITAQQWAKIYVNTREEGEIYLCSGKLTIWQPKKKKFFLPNEGQIKTHVGNVCLPWSVDINACTEDSLLNTLLLAESWLFKVTPEGKQLCSFFPRYPPSLTSWGQVWRHCSKAASLVKHQCVERKKMYCKANQGQQVAPAQKTQNPHWFSGKGVYEQNLESEL